MEEYTKQVTDFLQSTNTTIKSVYQGHKEHFEGDKEKRAVFKVTISRPNRKPMVFDFGESIADSYKFRVSHKNGGGFLTHPIEGHYMEGIDLFKQFNTDLLIMEGVIRGEVLGRTYEVRLGKDAPEAYSILSCLTKSEVGSFEDFCSDFGYDEDSMKANKTYLAVTKEYANLRKLGYSDSEMEQLQDIA